MAGVASPTHAPASPVAAHVQLAAILWLRWRLFVNSFNRGHKTARAVLSLLLKILLRIFVWSVVGGLVLGVSAICGYTAWQAVAHHRTQNLAVMLALVAGMWQFLSIQGQGVSASISAGKFDMGSLLRFPLPFRRYLLLLTVFGSLSFLNVVGCLAMTAVAIGTGIANPKLAAGACVVYGIYSLANILFASMISAWTDRFFAIRRFREVFGVLAGLVFLSFQLISFRIPGTRQTGGAFLFQYLSRPHPFLAWSPAGFAANSILGDQTWKEVAQFCALLAYTLLFLALFAFRAHKQFLGEYLTEGSPAPASARAQSRLTTLSTAASVHPQQVTRRANLLPPTIEACLRKEWLELKGSATQLLGPLAPIIFVLFAGNAFFGRSPGLLLPGAVVYVIMPLLARVYNIFGSDGSGVQIYLLAPVRIRDVIIAKNAVTLTLVLVFTALAWAAVTFVSASTPMPTQIATALWLVFLLFTNLAIGTLRSIQAPRKFIPGRARRAGAATSRTSRLLVTAAFLASIGLFVPVMLASSRFGIPWLPISVFAVLGAVAIIGYLLVLHYAEPLALSHRDLMAEELCRI